MKYRTIVRGGLAATFVTTTLSVLPLWSFSGGNPAGCASDTWCHVSPGPGNPGITFSSIRTWMMTGSSDAFSVRVTQGTGTFSHAGFWLSIDGGNLTTSDSGISISSGTSAIHNTPKPTTANFTMTFTAPNSEGQVTFDAWGNAVNRDSSSSGDNPEFITHTISICADDDNDGNYSTASGPNCSPRTDCADNNPNRHGNLSESCDGIDNDCDNAVDEGLPNSTCGVGACARTGSTCSSSSCTPGSPSSESCNGVDDDCDGSTDEGLPNSTCGVGACARTGSTCFSNSCTPGSPSSESCNGIDDDCDGSTDEGLPNATCGVGACRRTGSSCSASSCTPGTPTTEICDNIDNDCDGSTDEGCDDDGDDYCQSTMTVIGTPAVCPNGGGDCNDGVGTTYPGAPEICNNISDDCDGSVDEGCDDDGDDYCDGNRAKAAGVTVSACPNTPNGANSGDDCDDDEPTMYPGRAEDCDGLDNDCNNQVDDNIMSLTCGQGICQAMASGCIGGIPQMCTPGTPGTESCSNQGVDNDCDGSANELTNNVFAGDPCTVSGAQGICAPGTRACSGSNLVCVPNQSQGTESCANTGTDDDCDGDSSELTNNVHTGDACVVPGAQGVCAPGTRACSGNSLTCIANRGPGTETCANQGVDNDCDGNANELENGILDNDVCNTGLSGVCSSGRQSCSGNSLLCIPDVSPGSEVEICDGLDNDCDGSVDNNIPDLTCGVGACQNTVPACSGNSDNTCTPLPSSEEICDGIDNDCDGRRDEGCDNDNDDYCDAGMVFSGSSPLCPFGPGDCDDQAATTYPGAPELCDGLDNDCNDVEDDDVEVITCGVGECSREATGCTDGIPENCTPGPEEPEVCDGLDNDCDGSIDEGIKPSTCGVGECETTGTSCLEDSCTPLPSSPEICDGLDNDCNGEVDEVEDLPLAVCGVGACERTGATCDPDSCTPGTPLEEICDGIDNDCNGVPDDGLAPSTCGVGECANVGGSCLPSSCQPLTPELEACDGLDNDCDGVVDNGCDDDNDGYCDANLVFVGSPICENGPNDCDDQFADSHPGAPELCDDKDNDCNGQIDDILDEENILCGMGACIAAGTECVDGEAIDCTPLKPGEDGGPNVEVCNGIDDDCNGIIDDHLEEVVCGKGECMVVVSGCTDGEEVECEPLEPTTEICDGLDNDCDGEADNEGDEGPLCDEGVCVAGTCVVLDSSQGGASGVIDYSGIDDDDPSLWLEETDGPGTSLPPEPTDNDSMEDPTGDGDDADTTDQKGGCSVVHAPHSSSNHHLWYIFLAGLTMMARRRRTGT